MLPRHREPTHPGEVLAEDFMKPLGMTQTELAAKLDVHVQQINLLVKGRRGVTAHTALMLADAFDTTPHFWLNLQNNYDLWREQRKQRAG